jgi:nicotinamidase-related amidase
MRSHPVMGAAVAGLADWIAPARAALVIIDMQVDFASPEGAIGAAGVDMSVVQPALAAAERLAAAARAAGAPVVFVGLQTDAAQDSAAWLERMARRGGDPKVEAALCRRGSPGAAFVGPTPLAGEPVIAKRRYSAFFEADLDGVLQALGVDTLVVCGLTTECCVDCTVRDAFHRDYHVFIVSDACAAYDPAVHLAALASLEQHCAMLTITDAAVAVWRERAAHG